MTSNCCCRSRNSYTAHPLRVKSTIHPYHKIVYHTPSKKKTPCQCIFRSISSRFILLLRWITSFRMLPLLLPPAIAFVVVVHLVDGHNVVDLSFKLNSETNGGQSLGLFTGPDRKSYGLVFVVHFAFGLIDCISVGVGIAGIVIFPSVCVVSDLIHFYGRFFYRDPDFQSCDIH